LLKSWHYLIRLSVALTRTLAKLIRIGPPSRHSPGTARYHRGDYDQGGSEKGLIKCFMAITSYISALALAIPLLADGTTSVVAAEKGKNPPKQHGATSSKNSSKPSTNQKEWSADPERGWVRSDDSQSIQRRDRPSSAPTQTDRKNRGTGKASKRF
jgi:hypothetical protein